MRGLDNNRIGNRKASSIVVKSLDSTTAVCNDYRERRDRGACWNIGIDSPKLADIRNSSQSDSEQLTEKLSSNPVAVPLTDVDIVPPAAPVRSRYVIETLATLRNVVLTRISPVKEIEAPPESNVS